MARNKLTDSRVRSSTKPGRYGDGDGLWLHVAKAGSKSWVFIYIRQGRRREMGLGAFGAGTGEVTLAAARVKADEVRGILGRGGDPFADMTERQKAPNRKTFAEVVTAFIEGREADWRNDKHKAQWKMTLGDGYCRAIGRRFVDEITTDDVVAILGPIWRSKYETASRLRGRLERVLDFARVEGLRTGENPARWKGHLEHRLSSPTERMVRGHHAAMPYADVGGLISRLREAEGIGARALEFTILTAARTGETVGARFEEVDLETAVWTVPGERMKAGRPHRVPLSPRAVEIVGQMRARRLNDYVFPGVHDRRHMSTATMTKALATAGGGAFTVHGFRSSFRDWAAEQTAFPDAVAEAALAHIVGDAVERAYRRGDALEKRRKLMVAWASYIARGADSKSNVIALKKVM